MQLHNQGLRLVQLYLHQVRRNLEEMRLLRSVPVFLLSPLYSSIERECEEYLKKTAWLIFIIAKVRILQRRGDIFEFAYMIAATIHIVVMNSP